MTAASNRKIFVRKFFGLPGALAEVSPTLNTTLTSATNPLQSLTPKFCPPWTRP